MLKEFFLSLTPLVELQKHTRPVKKLNVDMLAVMI